MAWPDFIETFMEMTDGVNSPDQFRLWTAISLVAGACERRVWARAARAQTFPNLYVLLTAAPGVGKQVISLAKRLWRITKDPSTGKLAFHVAPTQMTKAALVDSLKKAHQFKMLGPGNFDYHCMLIAAEEFQVLLPSYDTEYISALNEIFNCPDLPYEENRRTGSVKDLSIANPVLNILAGVQPSYFTQTFPEEAWTTGLARRIIMIHAAEAKFQELFQEGDLDIQESPQWVQLQEQLGHISVLHGQATWDAQGAQLLASWHRNGGPPAPTHSKLQHYNNSRTMFAIKLSLISAVAGTGALHIRELDVKRAIAWLTEAETKMPDVFREMIGKSDSQVIDELHYMMVLEQAKRKGQPLNTSELWQFLRQRLPSEKIEKVLLSAKNAGIIKNVEGAVDLWLARPITGPRGVE